MRGKINGKKRKSALAMILCMMLLSMALLTGCQGSGGDVPQITKDVAKAMDADSGEEAEPLQEENELAEDGIVSQAQMGTIAGKKGIYHFNGETADGISYQWEYDGEKIQNPIEQKLKVECTTDGVENVQKAANDAPYGLGVVLEEMGMAAPATLSLTLTEEWDADKVIYCTYEDGKAYQLSAGEIEQVKNGKQTVTRLTFPVTKAGDTFYVLAGSSKGSGSGQEEEISAKAKKKTGDKTSGQTQTESGASEEGDSYSQEETQPEEGQPEESGQEEGETWQPAGTEVGRQDVTQPDGQAQSEEEQPEETHICTISIECSTLVGNSDLKPEKAEFVPADGWILPPTEVTYTPGESVFDVLKRSCEERSIQMESNYTPIYGSYYIEGINQLYEFDGGGRSGWMYCVNGWYPNYGCSSYTVEDGDSIEWRYTCTLGSDVGNNYMGGDE